MNKTLYIIYILWFTFAIILGIIAYTSAPQVPNPLNHSSTPARNPTSTPSPTPIPTPIAAALQLPQGTHTFQTFNNCGPASLSMALSHFNIQATQQLLGQQLRPYQHPTGDNDDKSVTLTELASLASEYNLTAFHRPAGNIQILNQLNALGLPVITRTWLKPDDYIGHYRVVTGYDQTSGTLTQDDSLQGKNLTYSNQQFLRIWQAFNYEFLVLVPPEQTSQVQTILGPLADETTAWQTALQLSQSQLQSNPQDIYASFNASVASYHLGEYQQSIDYYEPIKNELPFRMLWYQLEPLLAYYQIEDYPTVITTANAILQNQNRAYSEVHQILGHIYADQGLTDLSNQSFQQAKRYNSTSHWKANLPSQLQ